MMFAAQVGIIIIITDDVDVVNAHGISTRGGIQGEDHGGGETMLSWYISDYLLQDKIVTKFLTITGFLMTDMHLIWTLKCYHDQGWLLTYECILVDIAIGYIGFSIGDNWK